MAWWWDENWKYRKTFAVNTVSGTLSNFPMEMYIGESSTAFWQLDTCEAAGNFTTHNSSITTDTGIVGSKSVKITGTAADSGAYWRPWRKLNFNTIKSLKFFSKRSAGATSSMYIFFSGSWSNYVRYDYTNTTDWAEQEITLSNYAASVGTINWSEVFAFRFDVDGNGAVLWIDDLKAIPKSHMNGKGLATFNDLRFTDRYNSIVLDYCIEWISGTTPNQVAKVHVELDHIETNAQNFNMYYGYADAPAYSNGANTFTIFDDFERGNNGDAIGGGWSVVGTSTISTEQKSSGTRSAKLFGVGSSSATTIFRALTAQNNTQSIKIRFFKENNAIVVFSFGNGSKNIYFYINTSEALYYYTGSHVNASYTVSADTWHLLEINNMNFTAGTYNIFIDGLFVVTATMNNNNWWNNCFAIYNNNSTSGNDVYADDVMIGSWRSVMPIIGDWGNEEDYEADEGKRYWVGGTGVFTDVSHWAFSSGGLGGKTVPTPNEEMIIDENSFSGLGQYIEFPNVPQE